MTRQTLFNLKTTEIWSDLIDDDDDMPVFFHLINNHGKKQQSSGVRTCPNSPTKEATDLMTIASLSHRLQQLPPPPPPPPSEE